MKGDLTLIKLAAASYLALGVAACSPAGAIEANPTHRQALQLFLKCYKDPAFRPIVYEANLQSATYRFEDEEMTDADRLNGWSYRGVIQLHLAIKIHPEQVDPRYPFPIPLTLDWQEVDYVLFVGVKNGHMALLDSAGAQDYYPVLLRKPCHDSDELPGSATGSASTATTPPAAPAPPPPPIVITTPDWESKPTSEDVAEYYPAAARRLHLSGSAMIDCIVMANGMLADCEIADEQPLNAGFGDAALKMAHLFRMSPATRDGRPVSGAKINIPISFSAPK